MQRMNSTGVDTSERFYRMGYDRGVQHERQAIIDHISGKLDTIIRTVGYRTFENLCNELEQIIADLSAEKHL